VSLRVTAPNQVSLYQVLRQQLGDRLPSVRFTKTTLIHLSHALEDIVLQEQLPALMLVGFQESLHWQQETGRYTQLTDTTHQIYIFSGTPLTTPILPGILPIELQADDPLRDEWYIVILCKQFSIMLCALDVQNLTADEEEREFETLWSFEPEVVMLALDTLQQVVQRYCPEENLHFQAIREACLPITVNTDLVSRLTLELLRFEDHLNQRLRQSLNLIAESEERFKQVITSIPYQVYMLELNEVNSDDISFMYHSPNFTDLTGYPVTRLSDLSNFWANHLVHPEDRRTGKAQFDRLRQGLDSTVEYRIIRASGEEVWVQDSARSLPGSSPGKRQIYGIINDITGRRRLEEALRTEEKLRLELSQERELNVLKNSLMTTLSHEFRTPLAAILSASELIERYGDRLSAEEYSRRLGIIREQIQHLSGMLDDINKVIHTNTTRLNFDPIPADLHRLLEETIEIIQHARRSTHEFMLTITGDNRLILLDHKLMRQILVNLLDNAVKYSPAGGQVLVYLSYEATHVRLQISDTGIGIPSADQAMIFEPFHRAINVGMINGTGLGLKIVHDYVDLHRGHVSCHSVEGQGTTFTVLLPG
jgi:PAS domain S-box-containing protein